MKFLLPLLFFFLASASAATAQDPNQISPPSTPAGSLTLRATNPLNIRRNCAMIEIDLKRLYKKYPKFNSRSFIVTSEGKEIPSQLDDQDRDGHPDLLLFMSCFKPRETKSFKVIWKPGAHETHIYSKLTAAALGINVGYRKVNGYYAGGRFVDVDSTTVPPDHFAHDALYRIEGPGWESSSIVYRCYLDSRNRNDIFGKKTHDMVLEKIGTNDLVSDGKESYTKMLDWGMDIFKVGESLGIGSIAMWSDSGPVTVSRVDRVKCYIQNGPLRSGAVIRYLGWEVGGKKYDLFLRSSIDAESRLTRVSVAISDPDVELCTGFAKHEDCDLLKPLRGTGVGWTYFALYGKQSLAGDNLGIAVFYRTADKLELTADGLSEIVVLRPTGGRLEYYFGAAWEEEPGGIKNEGEFTNYLDRVTEILNNPIRVSL